MIETIALGLPSAERSIATVNAIDSARPSLCAAGTFSKSVPYFVCPVAIVRGTRSSELTAEQAKEIAGCWKNAVVIDVEGDYALQMENPVGLAQALLSFVARADAH